MIDDVIYGPIPSANIETLPNAPPVNKSKKPKMLLPEAMLEKNSLLIDKFSCFTQQKPNTLNSENSFLSSQNLLHKVILIQTKFRLYLNRKSDRKQISLRARKTFTIPIRAKNQIFKTTKQSSIRSIFSTQK